jgi:hypothetical protein
VTAAIGTLVPVIWERYNTFWRGLKELDLVFYASGAINSERILQPLPPKYREVQYPTSQN